MSDYSIVKGYRHYYVQDAKGVRVSGYCAHLSCAQQRMDNLARKAASRERLCITCREPFESEGIHNRMCSSCRREADLPPQFLV